MISVMPLAVLNHSVYMNLPLHGWIMERGSAGGTGTWRQHEEEDSEGGCEGGNIISVKTQ